MTLDDTILAQQEKARRRAGTCDDKDIQLLRWLEELRVRRGAVDHPGHYTACGGSLEADGQPTYEVIKVIERLGLARGFCLGNAIKYILRARHKGSELQDLLKARWYLQRWNRDQPTNQHCHVDIVDVARARRLPKTLQKALHHLRGGWVTNAVKLVEEDLDERFPTWREEC